MNARKTHDLRQNNEIRRSWPFAVCDDRSLTMMMTAAVDVVGHLATARDYDDDEDGGDVITCDVVVDETNDGDDRNKRTWLNQWAHFLHSRP